MRRALILVLCGVVLGTAATMVWQGVFPASKPVPVKQESAAMTPAIVPGGFVGVNQVQVVRHPPAFYPPFPEGGVRVVWVFGDSVAPPTLVRLYRVYQETRPASDLNLSGIRPDYYGWGLIGTEQMGWAWNPKQVPENPRPLPSQGQAFLGTWGLMPPYWVKAILTRDNEILGETDWVPVYPLY